MLNLQPVGYKDPDLGGGIVAGVGVDVQPAIVVRLNAILLQPPGYLGNMKDVGQPSSLVGSYLETVVQALPFRAAGRVGLDVPVTVAVGLAPIRDHSTSVRMLDDNTPQLLAGDPITRLKLHTEGPN